MFAYVCGHVHLYGWVSTAFLSHFVFVSWQLLAPRRWLIRHDYVIELVS